MTERAPGVSADVRLAAQVLEEHRAVDLRVLDLRAVSDLADYFLIASGTSDTHVRALAEHLMETLKPTGCTAHHVEGLAGGKWVLIDFIDFVVHVFHPSLREFYQLERLWADATPVSAGLHQ
jgi:ribosome-associated protein